MRASPKIYRMLIVNLFFSRICFFFWGLSSVLIGDSLIIEWELLGFRSVLVRFRLVFDWIRLVFLGRVCLISSCIIKYSEYYIEGEINFLRFVYIILIFVRSMLFLILSPNLLRLLLGWDGLGLTSYCLVIFYQNEFSCNAGMLTLVSNRIGDVAILLRVALLFCNGSWDFYFIDLDYRVRVIFLVVIAGATKRAQIPFSAWLPAAIAAPTPVSALVHSSTLVTAGVYLLIRFRAPIYARGMGVVVLSVSVITIVIAGSRAMFERDIKKLVALSTLSQLGIIIIILRIGISELAFFHLVTHAIFKSILFMCTGFIIHRAKGTQDARAIRGFGVSRPRLGILLSSRNLALCGFPFLAGFYSKDIILEYTIMVNRNLFVLTIMILGVGLTVGYRFRILYLRASNISVFNVVRVRHDISRVVLTRVICLFIASLMRGFLIYWVCIPRVNICYLRRFQKFFIRLARLLGGVVRYKSIQKKSVKFGNLKLGEVLITIMWFMPRLRVNLPYTYLLRGAMSSKVIDNGWFEYYGGQGGRVKLLGVRELLQISQKRTLVKSYIISGLIRIVCLLGVF